MDLGIADRRAVVTGAAGGIGLETARILLEDGVTVLLTDIDEDQLQQSVQTLGGESDRLPRHARRYGDLARLQREMDEARRAALAAFRADVGGGAYPAAGETVSLVDTTAEELERRLDSLGAEGR